MSWFVSAALLLIAGLGSAQAVHDPALPPVCKEVSVRLMAQPARVKAGQRPQFALIISSNVDRPVRVLDVRNGRRPDLQHAYLELFVLKGRRFVDLPTAISDPGPLSSVDFLELAPRERVVFSRVSYTRALQELPPGAYDAFVLFWQDPMEPKTKRCRSTPGHFQVYK